MVLKGLSTKMPPTLPVQGALPDLLRALDSRTEAVLQAPPGAGKTTLVPLALLKASWLGSAKVLVLEPRRLAARAAAHRMAHLLGESVGQTVGYRVRQDTRVGVQTRIEVVTEGILTRMLQSDPSLEHAGCVVFDEFHERSLHADLGLALTLDAREAFRPDLRVLVMSATLDGHAVAALLGDAPVISSDGRLFPVETRYLDRPVEGRVEDAAAQAVQQALSQTEGDLLVFLPGAGEIRRTQERLGGVAADVRPLFGALSLAQQDLAVRPSEAGRRKVVLSTDIAETSLTIEGIRVVIDTGRKRGPLFDPSSGMSRLITRNTSKASADQRRGRAGRLGPGICFRLWTQTEHAVRDAFDQAEIRQADLSDLVLELATWGCADPQSLRWLDPPSASGIDSARQLLAQLGALTSEGRITPHGTRMSRLGVHPRLAHMLLVAEAEGQGRLGAELAALLEERDVLRGLSHELPADVSLRLEALQYPQMRSVGGCEIRGGTLNRVRSRALELSKQLASRDATRDPAGSAVGRLIASAYPDRVAQRVRDGHFRLRNGRPVEVQAFDPLAAAEYLAVASVGGGGDRHRAFLASPVSATDLDGLFSDQAAIEEVYTWQDRVVANRRRTLGAVILSEGPIARPDPERVAHVLLEEVARQGIHLLPWGRTSRQLQARLLFLRARDTSWPDRADSALLDNLCDWLVGRCLGMSRLADLKRLDLHDALLDGISWERRQELDRRAPTHLTVPSGSSIPIDYSTPETPVLAVRLQEVFGLVETPRVDGIPLTMHLLSPAQRPVQVTQDLRGFWQTSYFDVRKDLRGRYPKHYWPENPLEATPTARAKPRKR